MSTPKELHDMLTEHYQQQREEAQEVEKALKNLEEIKGSFRNQSGADWLTVMMGIIKLMIPLAKALHAGSPAKRMEDIIKRPIGEAYREIKGWAKDSLSWSGKRLAEKMGLKDRESLPDITVNIKINDKDGNFTLAALANGSIPLKDYFIRDTGSHSLLGATAMPGEPEDIAEQFEQHFQDGFEAWLKSKDCSIKKTKDPSKTNKKGEAIVHQQIVDKNDKPLTQNDLINLNKGSGNLSEFLSDTTKLAEGQKLNVTADPNDLPDNDLPEASSTPSPLPKAPKP